MTQLVKLEKRFVNALEKLELVLANKNVSKGSHSFPLKDKAVDEEHNNIDNLLKKVERLEKAARDDAEQIDRLIAKLKEILEVDYD